MERRDSSWIPVVRTCGAQRLERVSRSESAVGRENGCFLSGVEIVGLGLGYRLRTLAGLGGAWLRRYGWLKFRVVSGV